MERWNCRVGLLRVIRGRDAGESIALVLDEGGVVEVITIGIGRGVGGGRVSTGLVELSGKRIR